MLPSFVEHVRIQRLRLGNAQVHLLASRHAADVAVNVIDRRGDVRVIVEN